MWLIKKTWVMGNHLGANKSTYAGSKFTHIDITPYEAACKQSPTLFSQLEYLNLTGRI